MFVDIQVRIQQLNSSFEVLEDTLFFLLFLLDILDSNKKTKQNPIDQSHYFILS